MGDVKTDKKKEIYGCVVKTKAGADLAVESIFVGGGATLNMGNYSSRKVDIGLTLIPLEEITIDEVAEFGWGFVEKQLGQKVKKIMENKCE